MKSLFENKKIILFAHNGGGAPGGWDDEVMDYLLKNDIHELVNVKFPFGFNSITPIHTTIFHGKKLIKDSYSLIRFNRPEVVSYAKDFIYGIYYGIRYGKDTDLFIGMDNLLAFIGICLKKIGLVKKVGYCIIDYTPRRYQNSILNSIYYTLDRFACYHVDYVLPLNHDMLEGRHKAGIIDIKKVNYIVTPFGNHSDSLKKKKEHNRCDLIYFGGLLKSKGLELFVPIVVELLKKGHKNIHLHCIGGGDSDYLMNEIKQHKVSSFFTLHGPIADPREIEQMLLEYGVAIAPYYPEDKNNFSYYADPGKVKIYLGCGLPIVITDVPPISKIIQDEKAGLIASYDPQDIAAKIITIVANKDTFKKYQKNAERLGRTYSWNAILNNTFKQIFA